MSEEREPLTDDEWFAVANPALIVRDDWLVFVSTFYDAAWADRAALRADLARKDVELERLREALSGLVDHMDPPYQRWEREAIAALTSQEGAEG